MKRAMSEKVARVLPPCVATLAGLFYARVQSPLPALKLPATNVCKTSLGFSSMRGDPGWPFCMPGSRARSLSSDSLSQDVCFNVFVFICWALISTFAIVGHGFDSRAGACTRILREPVGPAVMVEYVRPAKVFCGLVLRWIRLMKNKVRCRPCRRPTHFVLHRAHPRKQAVVTA